MVRNIVLFSGSSHPQLSEQICTHLGIPPAKIHLSKFAVGETRVEIGDSVRGKDVFIVQSGGGKVNDHLMELLITISACKTASAKRVTAVLPLFPYSRQSDLPYNKVGAPLARNPIKPGEGDKRYSFESRPASPHPGGPESAGINGGKELHKRLHNLTLEGQKTANGEIGLGRPKTPGRNGTMDSMTSEGSANGAYFNEADPRAPSSAPNAQVTSTSVPPTDFKPQRGYKQWVAQAGTLVADLLTCAGADHVITMDLHDPQYQGFFDIPVDNLYGKQLLRKYIQQRILPKHGGPDNCVIVSPDAGGAKRATNIADSLETDFALIHKERRPNHLHDRQNATMLLVGSVAGRTAILVDDLADTSNTITRAAKLLKKEGAATVYALVTHGVFSGDACDRINASAIDKVVTTNSVPQEEHLERCPDKLEVLEVGSIFAEAIRRVHHGESISVLFQYD
ncbi:ribose-phosphate pyrophosphokinase 5-like [Teratosphaeria destructans]|uniref:Ribose-phosphate pyrophosphokinase 5-like n=1 Tax=Teratosphaeria destructans TaxID=418781 RepID=A0A9W7SP48_9PEZI|nr:ribose-phosphate pyrophosphokinase 5-like [Teratosphaeria destructans]